MNKLYIVRHGKTDWNNLGLLQGSTDIEINEEGIKEAKALSQKIDLKEIDICISSPLKRAKQTAEILMQNNKEIYVDDLLLERGFGDLEGKKLNFNLIKEQWDYNLNTNANNIEPLQECLKRANKFLKKIKKQYPNKSVLIVSHGSFIKALHFNLVGYNKYTDFLSFRPENSTLYTYTLR